MKQLIIFIVHNVYSGFIDNVDSGFSNSLGIDEINAYGSFLMIQGIMYCVYSLGTYCYRVKQEKEKLCFRISIVSGIITGIIAILAIQLVGYIYNLTEMQIQLLKNILLVYGCMVPFYAIGDFLSEYMTIRTKNKKMIVSSILYYIMLIGTDMLVIKLHAGIEWLVACTGICYIVYDIIVYIVSGIREERANDINKEVIIDVLRHGKDVVLARLYAKVGVLVYGAYASRLGSELYAIHNVCYTCGYFGENFTNGLYTYIVVRLKHVSKVKIRWKKMWDIVRVYGLQVLVAGYIGSLLAIIPLKGALSIQDCTPWLFVYCLEVISLVMYESYSAFLTVEEETKYIARGGIVGLIVRIIYVVAGFNIYKGIWVFATAVTLDYAIRGVYLGYQGRKVYNTNT